VAGLAFCPCLGKIETRQRQGFEDFQIFAIFELFHESEFAQTGFHFLWRFSYNFRLTKYYEPRIKPELKNIIFYLDEQFWKKEL
jgi:hypothetical protein